MIVMEYVAGEPARHGTPVVAGGALLVFLRKMEKNPTLRASPPAMVKMCVDAAAGMAYLEDKNCIHRLASLAGSSCVCACRPVAE